MDVQVFRPRANLVWGGVAIILDVLFLIQAVWFPSAGENLLFDLIVALAVAVAATLIWVRPKLVLRAESMDVVNPLTTETIAYRDILALETKWTLLVRHGETVTRVWVAPTNGKHRWIADSTFRWGASKLPASDRAAGEARPISDSHLSDSGVAATLIRQRMQQNH